MERIEDPLRFQRKPTLGELAVRRPPAPSKQDTEASMVNSDDDGGMKDGVSGVKGGGRIQNHYKGLGGDSSDEEQSDEYSHLLQWQQASEPRETGKPKGKSVRRNNHRQGSSKDVGKLD